MLQLVVINFPNSYPKPYFPASGDVCAAGGQLAAEFCNRGCGVLCISELIPVAPLTRASSCLADPLPLCWGYIGIMEKKMETIIL